MNNRRRTLAVTVLAVGLLNFAAFLIGTFVVGGDAVNGDQICGRIEGKYFLWNKASSVQCHEVTRATYLYSKVHCWSTFVFAPFIFAAAFYLNHIKRKHD